MKKCIHTSEQDCIVIYIYIICILSIYAEQVISYITYSSIYVIHCSSNAAFENLFTHSNSITISSSRLRCCCRITLHQNENFYSIWQRNVFTGGVIITKLYNKGARSIYRIVYFQKTMKDFQCWFFFHLLHYMCATRLVNNKYTYIHIDHRLLAS